MNFILEDKSEASLKKKKTTTMSVCGYFEDLCMIYQTELCSPASLTYSKQHRHLFFFFFFFARRRRGRGDARSRHQMQGLVGRSTLHKPKQQRKGARTDGRPEDEAAAGASSSSQPGARSPRKRRRRKKRSRGGEKSKQQRVTAA